FRATPPSPPIAPDDVVTISVRVVPPPADDVWREAADAGASIESAQVVDTSLPPVRIEGELAYDGDIDMYRIEVCAPGPVTATTVGGPSLDTQLFLFRDDGSGIVMNDDDPLTLSNQSRVQIAAGLEPGAYLLAVSSFNLDPLDESGAPIWNELRGEYILLLSGCSAAWTCTSNCPVCVADFNQDGGVDGSDLAAFFAEWEAGLACADTNGDGGIDGGDIETFIVAWEAGGC
ncbi:MAG: DVUA0089 family protein, partial [Planctomycetota bacterium]|nr:DVUA0089 family protein [Planctomycetota bacterium]